MAGSSFPYFNIVQSQLQYLEFCLSLFRTLAVARSMGDTRLEMIGLGHVGQPSSLNQQASSMVLEEVRRAEFVAFDLELTGLHVKNERFIGVERCYSAHREGARTFLPVQVGLCAARRDPAKSTGTSAHWILSPVSLYVFPQKAAEHHFSVSAATMVFLDENGFNFNNWVRYGLGWLRPSDEEEKRRSVQQRIDEVQRLKRAATATAPSAAAPSEEQPALEIPEGGGWVPSGVNAD
ncbi:unnamed protein product [Cladocopium goreaui]|uniref:Poly(A)-specific ribonuclease PARN (Deadenylatin g nuclease) (Deadenylation nuclease) (Polyadenylate-specific ribonuclease) n=1 Tax=Cladocopium goreaui TaxID=2562237 RepID=A0A9P1DI16_9DINO|nr:unnamed protein product [Cladocopium goreaui]